MSKKGEEKERKRRIKTIENARNRAVKRSPKTSTGEHVGLFTRISNFLKDVRRELKKVSWPARAETISSTYVVVSVVFVFGFYFYIVDSIVGFFVRKLLTLGLN
jgi:preprotein translocase subunit SecE